MHFIAEDEDCHPCYKVHTDATKGKYLVATRRINPNEEYIIKNEKPLVWNRLHRDSLIHGYCDQCGITLGPSLLECLRSHLKANRNVSDATEIMESLSQILYHHEDEYNDPLLSAHCIDCENSCGAQYCSEVCYEEAKMTEGHLFICHRAAEALINIRSVDSRGHLELAVKLYSKFAVTTIQEFYGSNTEVSFLSNVDRMKAAASSVGEKFLSQYHHVDFTRTIHAHRSGLIDIPDSLFENIIFPAYFASNLAGPLAVCKQMFLSSDPALWLNPFYPSAHTQSGLDSSQLSDAFVNSPIFADTFFSQVMGTFASNTLSIYVPSPLDRLLTTFMSLKKDSREGMKGSPPASVSKERLSECVDYLIQFNKHIHQQTTEVEGSNDACPRIVKFPGLQCTCLLYKFSKMNHSCVANTICVAGGNRVTVDVSADRVIECGEEITNSYINHCAKSRDSQRLSAEAAVIGEEETCSTTTTRHHQLDDLRYLNSKLTKKQRLRELRQYLFVCDCPLCESEEVDSDEDSDDSHDMT